MEIRYFDSLASTNTYCKLLDPAGVGEFTVIWAGQQTAGIGQKGNTWVSEPYKNLTFSLFLKPSFLPLADQWLLNMTIAVALADSITDILYESSANVKIKWPNDIYVDDRKVCGILVTNQVRGNYLCQSICGIGLNVNQTTFPDWVPNPTSLSLASGMEYELKALLDVILARIASYYNRLKTKPASIKPLYMSHLYRLGQKARYIHDGVMIVATITDVDRYGHLHLTTDEGDELVCDLKEVSFAI